MTTPHQPAPAGAYKIGDRFGQDVTESNTKALWEVPAVNFGNMLDLLRKYLLEAPIEALQGMLSFLPDFAGDINNAIELVEHVLSTLVDAATVTLQHIVQQIIDFFVNIVDGTTGVVGHVVDEFHAAWQNVLDFIGQGADGTSNSNNAITNTKGSISSLRQTVVATSAAVQALTSGAGAFDDFNRVDVTLGSDWDQELTFVGGGSGGWATDGTVSLYRPIYPYGTMEIRNRWKGATLPQSTTDYQYVAMVLGSAPGTDTGYTGWNDLLCCVNNTGAMTDYVRCRVRSNGDVHFSTFVGGTETQFYGIGGGYLTAGARVEFWCGDLATSNPHKYTLKINGSQTFTRTDLGATRSIGSGFRGWGYGGRVEGPTFAFSAPPAVPGTVNQWSGIDQL